MDCSPPGSSVHGILQARILEWVAISFSRGSSGPGIKPTSLTSPALAGRFFTTVPPGKPAEGSHTKQRNCGVGETALFWKTPSRVFYRVRSMPGFKASKDRLTTSIRGQSSWWLEVEASAHLPFQKPQGPWELCQVPSVLCRWDHEARMTAHPSTAQFTSISSPLLGPTTQEKKEKTLLKTLMLMDHAPSHPRVLIGLDKAILRFSGLLT